MTRYWIGVLIGAVVIGIVYSNWTLVTETAQECEAAGIAKALRFADETRVMAKNFNDERRMFPRVAENAPAQAYELSPGSITGASIQDPGPWIDDHAGKYFQAAASVSATRVDLESTESADLELHVDLHGDESAEASANLLTESQSRFLEHYCSTFECKGEFLFRAQKAMAATTPYLTMELVAADFEPLDIDAVVSASKAEDMKLFTEDCKDRWRK